MWTYSDPWDGVMDAVRLARAMTFKSAVAGLPLGGGKGVIMLPAGTPPPTGEARRAVLLDFADTVDALGGAYLTAEDVGTSEPDMRVIAEGTPHVTGLPDGSGDPSPWTAIGVEAAIRVACERRFGTDSLDGRTVSVVGLGHVGGPLAESLARGSSSPTSTIAAASSPTGSAPSGPRERARSPPRWTCSPPARWAACSTRSRRRSCIAR
jgi:leucine dehydrogenase